jgi:hypothetical protein
MKNIATIIILLFITNLCLAQNMNSGGPAPGSFYQELPYRQINSKIIIEVEIGGKKHQFLLDTGAPDQIEKQLADDLHLDLSKKSALNDAFNNTDTAYIVPVGTIKLGDVAFNNVPAMVKEMGIFKCFGIDGVIGSNLLRNCMVQFNSAKKTLIITNDAQRLTLNKQNAVKLNTKKDAQSSPFIVINITDKVTGEFLFDSGNLGFLEVSENFMNFFKKYNVVQVLSTGYGAHSFGGNGAEKNAAKYRIKFEGLQIGGGTFKNIITETNINNDRTGNRVGANLLDYGTVTIDYLHSKFYFDPFKPETDLYEKQWAVSPSYSDGKLVIGLVWDKLKDTVKPGLQIIAINDTDTQQIDICRLLTQKSLLNGKEQATLTLKDDAGKITKLDIVKQ